MSDEEYDFYIHGGGHDPYVQENGVLINKLGATDTQTLDRYEADFSSLAIQELQETPLPGEYDLVHLAAFHKVIFQDVYPWAGEIRRVDIGKGDHLFARHDFIEREAGKLFSQLKHEDRLMGLGAKEFSERAGHFLGEINALHPFREGNGRTQRAFIGQLAMEAGFGIAWEQIGKEAMRRAAIAAFEGDERPMARLILLNLEPRDRESSNENDVER